MSMKIEVPKLTSNSLLILIIVAQTDHKKPEVIPNKSAREVGKILPLSSPVIIKRPVNPAAMEKALSLADWQDLKLHRPFVEKTKADLVKIGHDLKAPLGDTWSCYAGRDLHCGKCGTCVERKEAFALAGVPDPTVYEN